MSLAALAVAILATPVAAQLLADELPAELDGVGIVQRLDEQVPLGLGFADHNGKAVVLSDLIDGERPVILTLNYYRCPQLCSLTLNGLVDGLREVEKCSRRPQNRETHQALYLCNAKSFSEYTHRNS